MKQTFFRVFLIYLITSIYTILRYHIFGDVLWKDFPVLTINKIIIFTAVLLMFLMRFSKKFSKDKKRFLPLLTFSVLLHILLSLILLKSNYVTSFILPDGSFSLTGNFSLLFASAAVALLFSQKLNGISGKSRQKLFLLLVGLHILFMGYNTWLTPGNWYGYFPPITLITFIMVFLLLVWDFNDL
jgi:hypothetical protein